MRRKLVSLMSLLAKEVEEAEEEERDNVTVRQRRATDSPISSAEEPMSMSASPEGSEALPLVNPKRETRRLDLLKKRLLAIISPFFTSEHVLLRYAG